VTVFNLSESSFSSQNTPVIGCDSVEQIEENVRFAASFAPLTDDEKSLRLIETLEDDGRIVVTGNSDKPHEPLFSCLGKGLDRTTPPENPGDLFVGPHIMDLPQVEIIRFHIIEGLMKMSQGALLVTRVRFACEKDIFSALPQGMAVISLAPRIGPRGLKVIDAEIDGAIDELTRFFPAISGPKHPLAPEADNCDIDARPAEPSDREIHNSIISRKDTQVEKPIPGAYCSTITVSSPEAVLSFLAQNSEAQGRSEKAYLFTCIIMRGVLC
jgi:hypothetical protein